MAEDLSQDVFIKLWEHRSKIDKKTVKAYLYTIALNLTINHNRRRSLHFKFTNQIKSQSDSESPQTIAEMNEYKNILDQALSKLSAGGREVFLMNRLEDLTYSEIAERLGLSVKAIEKRMSKALKQLKEQLGVDL